MTVLPTEITYGKVVGRFLLAVADTSDADRNPDAKPAVGTIVFTPVTAIQYTQSPVPTTIIKQKIVCSLNIDGEVVDSQGNIGVWLVAEQQYDVTYTITNAVIDTHRIAVTSSHTDASPLDLTLAIPPSGPAPTVSQYNTLNNRLIVLEAYPKITASPAASPPPNPVLNQIWVKY